MRRLFVYLLLTLWCASACAETTATTATPTIEHITALAITDAPTPTSLPSPEPTVNSAQPLVIWFPDALAPLESGDAAEQLSEQISAFQNLNQDVFVELRLKRAGDVGGIMSTLRAAAPVASGALPDLTLMRRTDLLSAQQSGLIQPIDERALPATITYHPSVDALGRTDGALFGLPYMIDVRHLAMRADEPISRLTFADIFERELGYVFPAGRVSSISETFLIQYRAARDETVEALLPVDLDALFSVFAFYDNAVDAGLISPSVTDFTQTADYLDALRDGEFNAGVVTSSAYLRLLRDSAPLVYAPIPTESGEPVTMVDGWMWVLTTNDAARQARALRFIAWMLDTDRQNAYASAADLLPAQRAALRQNVDTDYADFIDNLLNAATLPISEMQEGAVARILQSAFVSVISDARTPAQAINDVITQLPE